MRAQLLRVPGRKQCRSRIAMFRLLPRRLLEFGGRGESVMMVLQRAANRSRFCTDGGVAVAVLGVFERVFCFGA